MKRKRVQLKPLLIICDVNVLISVAMAKGSTVNLLRESWKIAPRMWG